ncbi:hypothetical protein BT63DRAFT_399334 [Microthyrium microscopicum]|uniref:Ribosome quality control complex subunit 2 n=1 Tax=Microthyrium microscopicum TaxID=703497 RepID=A0A6A6UH74_9PEZI|nr:hypothetical protein BT63DRAFT_399334 [Microthyrium microscopicum]
MKQRFSSLDVQVMSHELSQKLLGLRVHNIYDLSSRIFLFKFQKPDHREQVIVDAGFRCHLTSFVRTTAAEPSVFVRRLRKLIGSRRVTKVSQVGTDRIIEFQFSDGTYRLYLEFYAAGNIVVTDQELKVLALFRNVAEGAEHEQLTLGSTYNLESRQNYGGVPELTRERIQSGLKAAVERSAGEEKPTKGRKKQAHALRKALVQSLSEFPPVLVEHALRSHEWDPAVTPEAVLDSSELLDGLLEALKHAQKIVTDITGSEQNKGYIIAKRRRAAASTDSKPTEEQQSEENESLLYEDFAPFKPKQFEDNSDVVCLEFEGFNKTVDEFFSSIEGQKLDSKLQERELTAKRKLDETRKQHQQRLGSLKQTQELNIRKAEAIQANVERVTEATAAVNGLIAQGMDWDHIGRLIEAEQKRGNPVAQTIRLPLKLHENTVTLLLGEPEGEDEEPSLTNDSSSDSDTSDSEEEEPTRKRQPTQSAKIDKRLAIDVELSLSPWANAEEYYDQKKAAAGKEERAAQASSMALKNAERKITADLKKGLNKEKEILRPVRQPFWFEKFYFFISSDGYLVLAGKDGQQTEFLYKRHLRKGDIFVHADINGASPVIIKNNPSMPDAPVPPSTLSQAGTLSVVTSSAWDSKALLPSWWVHSDQVSKMSPNGDYLQPASFHIKGSKNFLPPAQLLVGVGMIFEVSEESKANHNKNRFQYGSTEAPEAISPEDEPAKDEESEGDFPEAKAGEDNDDDSDEDFPDAAPVVKVDSDDEDFPEAKPADDSDSDEETEQTNNPLQPKTNISDSDEDSDAPTTTLPLRSAPVPSNPQVEDDSTSIAPTETTLSSKPGARHLSAKERRLLKKGIDPSSVPRNTSNLDSDDDTRSITTSAFPGKSTPLPRGKRTKLKKAAAKYAHQDEADRAAALARLGSAAPASKTKEDEAATKKTAELEAQAQKQRRREQHLKAQAVGRAEEDARMAGGEEDEVGADMGVLDRLVGRLLPGDEIVATFPVCAPWSALSTFKYRAKMQPGALKKGKAAREVLGKWQAVIKVARNVDPSGMKSEFVWPNEAAGIAGVKETEVIAVMPVGKVRVMMPGGNASGKDVKGKGKAARGGKGSKRR